MKKILILTLICFTQNIFSQENYVPKGNITNDENKLYNTAGIDVAPEFIGGMNNFYKFISQNYRIPKEKPASTKGKVFATFVIEKDGSLNDIKILRDIGYGTGEEAIRVLKLCPKWNPGKLKDKEVRVLYAMPIAVN
jgi:protein TonB